MTTIGKAKIAWNELVRRSNGNTRHFDDLLTRFLLMCERGTAESQVAGRYMRLRHAATGGSPREWP